MNLAVETTYRGPTNFRGARVIAKSSYGRTMHAWHYSLGTDENHRTAALEHITRKGLYTIGDGVWADSPSGRGMVTIMQVRAHRPKADRRANPQVV